MYSKILEYIDIQVKTYLYQIIIIVYENNLFQTLSNILSALNILSSI
jgi:hypothetical protein